MGIKSVLLLFGTLLQRRISTLIGVIVVIGLYILAPMASRFGAFKYLMHSNGIVEWFCGITLLVFFTSILFVNRWRFESLRQRTSAPTPVRKQVMHWHQSYIGLMAALFTIYGFLFTIYSDVFYQQSSPVRPIIEGLAGNVNVFELDSIFTGKDSLQPTHLVFMFDISGSTREVMKDVAPSWVKETVDLIATNELFLNSEDMMKKMEPIYSGTNINALQLSQLLACSLVVSDRGRFMSQGCKRDYVLSMYSFGEYSNLNDDYKAKLGVRAQCSSFVSSILDLKHTSYSESQTNAERLIQKFNAITPELNERNAFERPGTVLTIFSDFVNESEDQDSFKLKELLQGLSKRLIFVNLVRIPKGSKLVPELEIDFHRLFVNCLYSEQINPMEIASSVDLLTANYKSKQPIEMIVNSPFFVDSAKVAICSSMDLKDVSVKISKIQLDGWQQFRLNERPIAFGVKEGLSFSQGKASLSFSGHVPSQFSNLQVEFEDLDRKERVTAEIIFMKGLPSFVARIMFVVGVLIFLTTFGYVLVSSFQIYHFGWLRGLLSRV